MNFRVIRLTTLFLVLFLLPLFTCTEESNEKEWKDSQVAFFANNPEYSIPAKRNLAFIEAVNRLLKTQESRKMTDAQIFEAAKKECDAIFFPTVRPKAGVSKVAVNRAIKAKAPARATDGRFIADSNGTVQDTKTNLMWAAKDNGSNINWADAKSYCENYRGGGYSDWRMPTQEELAGLYDPGKSRPAPCLTEHPIHIVTELIDITCFAPWASEERGSEAAYFFYSDGFRGWYPQVYAYYGVRALPVRSGI